MNNDVWEALQVIKRNKAHVEAIKFLSQDMQNCIDKISPVSTIRASSLRMIKK